MVEAIKEIEIPLGVQISKDTAEYRVVLTPTALDFLLALHERFNERRKQLMKKRHQQQTLFDSGVLPDFKNEDELRKSHWTIAPPIEELEDQRAKFIGPVNDRTIAQVVDSNIKAFIADFGVRSSWNHYLHGHQLLANAIDRESPEINLPVPSIFLKPRGWHAEEKNLLIHGQPGSASLTDFGLFFYHCAYTLIQHGCSPCFYLPKLEDRLEARLWNEVFIFAQSYMGLPIGSIKANIGIETVPATFQIDEILFELKDHACGLVFDQLNYTNSFICKFKNDAKRTLPNFDQLSATNLFISSYIDLVVQTAHRRGIHAMGICDHPNKQEIEKSLLRGVDGLFTRDLALVSDIAKAFSDHEIPSHQINNKRRDVEVGPGDLVKPPTGTITEEGIQSTIAECLTQLTSVIKDYHMPLDQLNLRINQLKQWEHHQCQTVSGKTIDTTYLEDLIAKEILEQDENERIDQAEALLNFLLKSEDWLENEFCSQLSTKP